jgi:hypothetical protein
VLGARQATAGEGRPPTCQCSSGERQVTGNSDVTGRDR